MVSTNGIKGQMIYETTGWFAVSGAVLLTIIIGGLARQSVRHLYAQAIAVYGGKHNLPCMRWSSVFVMLWLIPLAIWVMSHMWDSSWAMCAWLLYIGLLAWLALIDARTGLLPNELTLVLLVAGVLWQTFDAKTLLPPTSCCWGVVLGWLVPTVLNTCHERWRGLTAIGQGDARLLAGVGAWLGVSALPSVWIMACLSMLMYLMAQALFIRQWQSQLAFGPFLALAGAVGMWRDVAAATRLG